MVLHSTVTSEHWVESVDSLFHSGDKAHSTALDFLQVALYRSVLCVSVIADTYIGARLLLMRT